MITSFGSFDPQWSGQFRLATELIDLGREVLIPVVLRMGTSTGGRFDHALLVLFGLLA
jgi:thiamine pyrophosphokinase